MHRAAPSRLLRALAGGGQEPAAVMGRPHVILGKLLLGPLLLAQAKRLRKTALRLPEAAGPQRHGFPRCSFAGRAAAACWWWVTLRPPVWRSIRRKPWPSAGRQLAARTGQPGGWQLVAQSGVNSLEALDLLGRHEIGPATILVVALGVNDVTSQMSRQVANLRSARAPDGASRGGHRRLRACRPCTFAAGGTAAAALVSGPLCAQAGPRPARLDRCRGCLALPLPQWALPQRWRSTASIRATASTRNGPG
jgi:hypothetical protein